VGAGGDEAAGDVRVVELEPRPQSRRVRFDLHASAGGIVAFWVLPASSRGRLD